jgi:hypothetical protein
LGFASLLFLFHVILRFISHTQAFLAYDGAFTRKSMGRGEALKKKKKKKKHKRSPPSI